MAGLPNFGARSPFELARMITLEQVVDSGLTEQRCAALRSHQPLRTEPKMRGLPMDTGDPRTALDIHELDSHEIGQFPHLAGLFPNSLGGPMAPRSSAPGQETA